MERGRKEKDWANRLYLFRLSNNPPKTLLPGKEGKEEKRKENPRELNYVCLGRGKIQIYWGMKVIVLGDPLHRKP